MNRQEAEKLAARAAFDIMHRCPDIRENPHATYSRVRQAIYEVVVQARVPDFDPHAGEHPYIVREGDREAWGASLAADGLCLPIPYVRPSTPSGFRLVKVIKLAKMPDDRSNGRVTLAHFIQQVKVGAAYARLTDNDSWVHRIGEFVVESADALAQGSANRTASRLKRTGGSGLGTASGGEEG